MMGLSEEAAEHVKTLRDVDTTHPIAAAQGAIDALVGMLPGDEDWRWFDVGTMTRDEVRALGGMVSVHGGLGGSVLVDYCPGDSTYYQVLFSTSPHRVASDEGVYDEPRVIVSIPNHGVSYVLGDGWVHWTYVQEHWGLSERSAMAVANLLNAIQGEL